MRRSSQFPAQGFTLLEVMIAAVLMGSVFVAVVSLLSQSLGVIDRMDPHTKALHHATEKMNEYLLPAELQPGGQTGQWDDGYRWQAQITQMNLGSPGHEPNLSLYRVRVLIAWGPVKTQKSYVVETVRWAPKVVSNAAN